MSLSYDGALDIVRDRDGQKERERREGKNQISVSLDERMHI